MPDDIDFTGVGSPDSGQQGGNPAWQPLLADLPQELHAKVTPHLQNWDRGVNDRFQKVHSEYEPWKDVIKSGAEPDVAKFALNLLNQLEQDPALVYKAIGDYYKLGTPEPQLPKQGPVEPETPDPVKTQLDELARQNQIMAQVLVQQRENEVRAQQQAKADAALEEELTAAKKKFASYGDFNERYVLSMMQSGMTAEQAAQDYFNWRAEEVKKGAPRPLIVGSGGGMPGQNADTRKMDDRGVKNLVADMLRAAAEQNR